LRDYELTVILSPELSEEEVPSGVERVTELVAQKGGVVSEVDHWGRRRLAYPIGRFMEGNYVLTHIQMEPQSIAELEAGLELSDNVLRYLVVRKQA
jgi:small subunit ribosomal protein S6